jgi:trafficking protein particle complex subunit 8
MQNLKMKVSHPRFLSIGDQEVMKTEFPGCLERSENFAQDHVLAKTNKGLDNVFLFPEVSMEHQISLPKK